MTKLAIYPYRQGSQSAHHLAQALGCPVLRHNGSRFKHSPNKVIINWGSSQTPNWSSRVLNPAVAVAVCSNKLQTFRALQGKVSIPDWTCRKDIAYDWHDVVVVRHILTGHSGNGIEIVEAKTKLPDAPLYVRYIPKDMEFRVHCMKINNEVQVIDIQRKIRDPDKEPTDWKVRSHDNGFIFVRGGFRAPEGINKLATTTLEILGLDTGAIDIIWNKKRDKSYVLEVN